MFFQALLVALVAGIVEWDIYGWGQTMISRPIVVGAIMGLVLGDLQTGLIIGGTVELFYLGVIPVGAAIPPDATSATSIATALSILSGIDPKVAPTIAIPVAMAAQTLQMFIWTVNIGITHRADKYAEEGNLSGIERLQYFGSFLFFLQGFIPAFIAVLFGVDAVKTLLGIIPEWFMNGLKIAGGMLPAMGFAMLYTMMSSKKLAPFFYIGFALAAFMNINLVDRKSSGNWCCSCFVVYQLYGVPGRQN